MDKILLVIVPTLSALAGIAISELFSWWKRREQYKGILFNHKLKFYKRLVGMTSHIAHELVLTMKNKGLPDKLPDDLTRLGLFLADNYLLATDAVVKIVWDFIAIGVAGDKKLDEKITEMGSIHRSLREGCQRELGLKALEKDIAKFSNVKH